MKQHAVYVLVLLLYGVTPLSHAGDLDDISIQVIGLEEIPEEALERIPLPGPGIGGLTDIREGIILNRPVLPSTTPPPGSGEIADSINGGGGLAPPTPGDSGGTAGGTAGGAGP